jgi:hypothetical protein
VRIGSFWWLAGVVGVCISSSGDTSIHVKWRDADEWVIHVPFLGEGLKETRACAWNRFTTSGFGHALAHAAAKHSNVKRLVPGKNINWPIVTLC